MSDLELCEKNNEDKPSRLFDIVTGWTCFDYGNIHIENISYVCDPHFDLADALVNVLEDGVSTSVKLDHEGALSELLVTEFGLVHINDDTCSYHLMKHEEIIELAKRFARELEEDRETWTKAWHIWLEEDAEEYYDYLALIDDTVSELKEAIRVAAAFEDRPLNYRRKTFRGVENLGVPAKVLV